MAEINSYRSRLAKGLAVFAGFLCLAVIFGAMYAPLAATVGAADILRVKNPEDRKAKTDPFPLPPPPLILPDHAGSGYLPLRADQALVSPEGRSIAQFASIPAPLQAASANLSTGQTTDKGEVSFAILASIRYTGGGHTVYVTTARPSAAALQQYDLTLGNQTVKLANGTTAWIDTTLPTDGPNRVVIVKDELIITVMGTLPIDVLQGLMTTVVMR